MSWRRLISKPKALTYRFEFKSQVQGGLMLHRPFFVRARQVCLDEAQIESGEFSFFDCGHDVARIADPTILNPRA